jgi:DNA-binding transcriptional MerR regulator
MSPTVNFDINVNVKESARMRIGELSEISGVSTRSLRYYEAQGLLPSQRQPNGYRDYAGDSADTVALIQDLYNAGFSSELIRDVLPCASQERPPGDCSELLDRVRKVRDELARRERRLVERREMLDKYLSGAETPRGLPRPPVSL